MGYIRWGGKKFYPQKPKPYKPDINELMKPLSEKVGKGNIWGSQIMNVEKDGETPTPPPAFDTDAALYLADVLSAGGTLDATISAATDTLFTSLKSNGLYNDLFFYPMLGGTSGSTALFGKRASGTTYDYTWTGTLGFGYSGVTGNAGRGTTILDRQTFSNLGDVSIGCYICAGNTGYDLQGALTDTNILITTYPGVGAAVRFDGSFRIAANPDGTGMYIATLTGSTSGNVKVIKNGNTTLINTTSNDLHYNTQNNWILTGGGGGIDYSDKTMAFVIYTKYLTDSQVLTLSTIINTFQTTLGRNTY